jgi:site-specific recombinase XerC
MSIRVHYMRNQSSFVLSEVAGKGEKTRYVPLHGVAADLIGDYLKKAGHGEDDRGALFRRVYRERKRPVGRDGP